MTSEIGQRQITYTHSGKAEHTIGTECAPDSSAKEGSREICVIMTLFTEHNQEHTPIDSYDRMSFW